MWERSAYNIFVRQPEGRRPLGTYGRRRNNNIKMDIKEIGCEDMDWTHLAENKE
jgi:hypothetical protein